MKSLLTGWHFMRIFRLVMAVVVAIQAYEIQSIFMGALSLILFYQVYANVGCCGVNACATDARSTHPNSSEIIYEEIK